jgi:hypothetical protein
VGEKYKGGMGDLLRPSAIEKASLNESTRQGMQRKNFLLIGKKVKNISQHIGIGFVEFRVFALAAGHKREAFALDIEYFTPKSPGCPYFTDFILRVRTFGTFVI